MTRYKQSDIKPTGGNKGEVKKTTETNTQLEIPNLFGHGKKKAKNIVFFKKDNTYPV